MTTLLSLPPELIIHILTFAPYPTTLSFICTSKHITSHIISPSSLRLLRRSCATTLLAWETDVRSARNWPLVPDPVKGSWCTQAMTYGESMYIFYPEEGSVFESLPCYGCLRFRGWKEFGSTMRSGGTMVGQAKAERRRCVPCGVREGVYLGGGRIGRRSVCVKCTRVMVPWNGVRCDGLTLGAAGEMIRGPFDGFSELRGREERDVKAFEASEAVDSFWWWSYSHMCAECTGEEGYSVRDLLRARPIKDRVVRRMKARYAEKRIASLERAREIRKQLGIPEPEEAIDIEALKRMKDPFPNFKPVPVLRFPPDVPPELEGNP